LSFAACFQMQSGHAIGALPQIALISHPDVHLAQLCKGVFYLVCEGGERYHNKDGHLEVALTATTAYTIRCCTVPFVSFSIENRALKHDADSNMTQTETHEAGCASLETALPVGRHESGSKMKQRVFRFRHLLS